MKKRVLSVLILSLITLASTLVLTACGGETEHIHSFDVKIANDDYVMSAATCKNPAKYYYSCSCREIGSAVFELGSPLGHDEVSHKAKAPTCTEIGWDTYVTCTRCDYTTYAEKAALGHTVVTDAAKAPTCTETGLTEGKHCSVCEETFVEQSVIAALGHDEVTHEVKAPTCTEIGFDAYVTCTRCDYTTYAEKAALGHNEVSHEAKAPTCTEIGFDAYVTCSRCDYTTYAEQASLGHKEVSHEAKVPTCTEKGWDSYVTCTRCEYTTYAEKAALGHTVVTDAAKAPTCTETGLTEGKHCSVCEETFVEQSVIAAPGHNKISHEAKAPTCTEIGWDAYETCSNCDYTTFKKRSATGHTPGTAVKENLIDATYTVDGSYDSVVYCSVCESELSRESKTIIASIRDYPKVPWADDDPIELFFMMSDNSSGESLPSGCNRYLAGGDQRLEEAIDIDVEERNSYAEYLTNVKLKYDYYPEAKDYGWGKCYELISSTIGTTGCPDMFCNFTYDMFAASLRGSFANLRNQGLDEGNFFSFLDEDYDEEVDNRGYMYEYMTSLTFSDSKMYLLASDYFIDLIRGFYIVPVNVKLLTDVGMEVTGDLNEDGKFDIEDFYEEIRRRDWDYKKVAAYSEAIYNNDNRQKAGEDLGDTLGWALHTGYISSGLIYSTDITVIERSVDESGNPVYNYPATSPQLYELFDKCAELVNSTGVYVFSTSSKEPNYDEGYLEYGNGAALAVRKRFCTNKLLFGGLIMLGGLEYNEYQVLKESSGFGVAPVPFYHEVAEDSDERYHTAIHNGARLGAIARSTKNYTACTAFLDYQSTHSTDILNNYYDRNLCLSVVDGSVDGTVEMLQYIRKNVHAAFDKTFEDAIGVYYSDTSIRWSYILEIQHYEYDIRKDYESLAQKKQGLLDTIYDAYVGLP